MDPKTAVNEQQNEWFGATPSLESPRQLQLTALLNDVTGEEESCKAEQPAHGSPGWQ